MLIEINWKQKVRVSRDSI